MVAYFLYSLQEETETVVGVALAKHAHIRCTLESMCVYKYIGIIWITLRLFFDAAHVVIR